MDPNVHLSTLSEATDPALICATLEEFGTFICIGMEDFVRGIDAKQGLQALLGVLKRVKDDDMILVVCHRCIALMLEYVPHSAESLVSIGAIPGIVETLKASFNLDLIEELLKTLRQVSVDDNTGVLVHCGAVPAIISSMERQDRRLHPSSIAILENIVVKINVDPAVPRPTKVKRMFAKTPAASSTTPSPAVVIEAIRSQIIPSLRGLLDSLCFQGLDQGGTRDVAAALCSCICTLAERCHRSVPDLLDIIVGDGFVSQLVGLLKTSAQSGEQRQQAVVLKTLGILTSISPGTLLPQLMREGDLLQLAASILHPKEQDFATSLQDPFGLRSEQERLSGGGSSSKSSVDLRSDVLHLMYRMQPPLPGGIVTVPPGGVSRIHTWEWEDDYHAYNAYDSATQSLLEKAFQEGAAQANASGRGTTYSIDIHCMKQFNPGSGVSRNVKRCALPSGYHREEGRGDTPGSAPSTPSVTKKLSGLRRDKSGSAGGKAAGDKAGEGFMAALLRQVALLKPESGFAPDTAIGYAKMFLSVMAGPLAQYAVQCSDTSRREWATESLARMLHATAAVVKSGKPGDLSKLDAEVQDAAPKLVPALVTLIGKGVSDPLHLDLSLLSAELLCAIGAAAAVPQQLRKAGLQEALTAVQAQAKALPPKLAKRVAAFSESLVVSAASQGVSTEASRKLAALTKDIGSSGVGVVSRMLQLMEEHGGDLCSTALHASQLVPALLRWVGGDDAPLRHRRCDELASAIAAHPAGARHLTQLLAQSAVALEALPITTPLHTPTQPLLPPRPASSSSSSSSSARRGSAPPANVTPAEFLRAIGRKGVKLRFHPCPMAAAAAAAAERGEGDGAAAATSSSGDSEGQIVTVDPFASVGCVERFLMCLQQTGSFPNTNGMRVLRGSRARHVLDGLAAGGEDGMLQELRRLEEESGDMLEEEEDEESDAQEVVILDSSHVSLYDEPSASGGAAALQAPGPLDGEGATPSPEEPPLLPYDSYTFAFESGGREPLLKTATMLEVLRQFCSHKAPAGMRRLDSLFSPAGAGPKEALEQMEQKAAHLKQKVQKLAGKRDRRAKPGPDEVEAKSKLEQLTQKMADLRKVIETEEQFDPWGTVIDLHWAPEGPPLPKVAPEVFLSDAEAVHWRMDRVLRPSEPAATLLPSVCDASLASLLQLLRIMHAVSSAAPGGPAIDRKAFVSPHLTAKLMQSLSANALRVAAFGVHGLPAWAASLPEHCSFLFPGGARREYAAFVGAGALKSLIQLVKLGNRIPNADVIQPEVLPSQGQPKMVADRVRLQSRANALLGATTWRRHPLEVQYDGEEGTGLGPTLEFFTLVSRELQKCDHHMWVGDASAGGHVVPPAGGLYPSASHAQGAEAAADQARFEMLGRLAARAVLDGRLLDAPLAPALLRVLKGIAAGGGSPDMYLSMSDLESLDSRIAQSLRFFVDFATAYDAETSPTKRRKLSEQADLLCTDGEEAAYYFTLPGSDGVPLKEGGESIPVTNDNAREFAQLALEKILYGSVQLRIAALRKGFEQTLPLQVLLPFDEAELCEVVCGVSVRDTEPLWTFEELLNTIVADHGYSSDSRCIHELVEILCTEFSPAEQRQFLNFTTGCPRLPVGGVTAIGKITVVRKTTDDGSAAGESHLPSCNTCFRYLKLPTYPTREILAEKLRQAIYEGSGSFSLS